MLSFKELQNKSTLKFTGGNELPADYVAIRRRAVASEQDADTCNCEVFKLQVGTQRKHPDQQFTH